MGTTNCPSHIAHHNKSIVSNNKERNIDSHHVMVPMVWDVSPVPVVSHVSLMLVGMEVSLVHALLMLVMGRDHH